MLSQEPYIALDIQIPGEEVWPQKHTKKHLLRRYLDV